jgi:hypothetical protein
MTQLDIRIPAGRMEDVRWLAVPSQSDPRGVLSVIEGGSDLPFDIQRVYYLHHLHGDRGGHAHIDTRQLIVAVSGSCELTLSNGRERRTYVLDNPERGLLLVPMLFIELNCLSEGAVVLVLASTHYDKKRSIRGWEDYLKAIQP